MTRRQTYRGGGQATLWSALLIGALLLSSCGIGGQIQSAVDKAVEVIDNGIRDISQNSGLWQSTLQRVANQLPQELDQAIRVNAQSLANRSIATAGVEFRCNTDFLGNRAVQSLQRLKAQVLKQPVPPTPPAFCQVDPAAVDLKIPPRTWSDVKLYGYDLDQKDSSGQLLSVALVSQDGAVTPLPGDRIGRTTHYQLTLNLGSMAAQLHRDRIAKIAVSWDGSRESFPEIVVLPWEGARQTVDVLAGSTGPFAPRHIGGDRDFDTSDDEITSVRVLGEIRVNEQTIENRVAMHAREREPDHTEVEGTTDWARAYTAPAGWRIVEVSPSAPSSHSAGVTSQGRLEFNRPGGEVVTSFVVQVDRDGDEAGTFTSVTAHWRPMQVTIEEIAPEWMR